MLIDFSFKNYRAFKDQQTISLVASSDKELIQNTISLDNLQDIKLLRSLVIYGANASGKTTVLDALNFCRTLVVNSARYTPEQSIEVNPFLLDNESKGEPVEFEFSFIQDNVRYQYGFKVTQKQVLEEWLISYPRGRARKLYQRICHDGKNNYSFSSYLKGEKEKLIELTGPTALFLSVGATFNNQQLLKVYKWFSEKLVGVKASKIDLGLFLHAMNKSNFKSWVREFIKFSDLGITDISIVEEDLKLNKIPHDAPEVVVKFFEFVKDWAEDQKQEGARSLSVKFLHQIGDNLVPFSLDDESEGTKQLLALSLPIINALTKGQILFIDEINSSLHPLLVQSIVNLFQNPEINVLNSQLIFNTHDVSLLDKSLFRRDQIWFTEKDSKGASHIYSLLDFSPRKQEALGKGYLQGRYGAIPFIGELSKEEINLDKKV